MVTSLRSTSLLMAVIVVHFCVVVFTNTAAKGVSAANQTTVAAATPGKQHIFGDDDSDNFEYENDDEHVFEGNHMTRFKRHIGICPTNGNTHVAYITTNSGPNIESFDTWGRYLGRVINMSTLPPSVKLQKLRTIKFGPDGLMYVTASRSGYSRIFALSPSGLPSLSQDIQDLSPTTDEDVVYGNNNGGLRGENNPDYGGRLPSEDTAYDHQFGGSSAGVDDVNGESVYYPNAAAYSSVLETYSYRSGLESINPDQALRLAARSLKHLPPHLRMDRDCTRHYVYTLARLGEGNPNMDHPYSFFFHPIDGTMYVSSQNSIGITRYVGPTTTKAQLQAILNATQSSLIDSSIINTSLASLMHPAAPVEPEDPMPFSGGLSGFAGMPLPPSESILSALALTKDYNSHPAVGATSHLNATVPPSRGKIPDNAIGVFAAGWNPAHSITSIRGIAISPPMLFSKSEKMFLHELAHLAKNPVTDYPRDDIINLRVVLAADVVGNAIHVFHELTGELLWTYQDAVQSPIQVHFPATAERTSTNGDYWFYVSNKEGGLYKLRLRRGQSMHLNPAVELAQPGRPLKGVSGMTESAAHDTLYVADRRGRAVYTYTTADNNADAKTLAFTGPFVSKLLDYPEYIEYTMVESQKNIPTCYELNSEGFLVYTSLCTAVKMYVAAILIGAGIWLLFYTRTGQQILSSCHQHGSPSASVSSRNSKRSSTSGMV